MLKWLGCRIPTIPFQLTSKKKSYFSLLLEVQGSQAGRVATIQSEFNFKLRKLVHELATEDSGDKL